MTRGELSGVPVTPPVRISVAVAVNVWSTLSKYAALQLLFWPSLWKALAPAHTLRAILQLRRARLVDASAGGATAGSARAGSLSAGAASIEWCVSSVFTGHAVSLTVTRLERNET